MAAAAPIITISSEVIMADYNLTPLARALSQPQLDLPEGNDVGPPRSIQLHPTRMRKLSSCNSLDLIEPLVSPAAAEARVLVINTGGTIGMTLHDNGSCIAVTLLMFFFFFFGVSSLSGGQVACW